MIKICEYCSKEYKAIGNIKCCSKECSKIINIDKKNKQSKEYYQKTKERQREGRKENQIEFRKNNPNYMKEYVRELRKDPVYKLHSNISRSIRYSLSINNISKNRKKWEDLVGYTTIELKEHLEKLFTKGMSWSNQGRNGWEVDHIRPISSFNIISIDCDDFKKCWDKENLQPLWKIDNLIKSNIY